MKRRDLLAGLGSVGALGAAGVVAVRGLPTGSEDAAAAGPSEPVPIETVEAPGSEAGTMTVPGDEPMLIDFFATTCETCKSQMPILSSVADATEATVLSVTLERDPAPIRDFWHEYDGQWPVGMDTGIDLHPAYEVVQTPTTLVVDAAGGVHWRGEGHKDEDAMLAALEAAREA